MDRKLTGHPFYTAVVITVFFFMALPVVYTTGAAFFQKGSVDNIAISLNKNSLILLAGSILVASASALFSTFFGTVSGFILYKTDVRFRRFFKTALLIPLFISPYILAVAWKDFFYYLFPGTSLISSFFGVVLVFTTIFTPLAMLITGSALSNIDASLEESGLLITSYGRTALYITLPLIKPALISSFVLVFIFSISNFSVPAYLGVEVFTTEIFTQFSAFYNHSLAIIQSSVLILICVLLLFSEKRYIADAPFLSIGTKGTKNRLRKLTAHHNLLSVSWLGAGFIVSVVLPFTVLFFQSFENGTDQFIKAFKLLVPAFGNSVGLATGGALVVLFTGFAAAYFTVLRKKPTLDRILLFTFATPSIIFGISLIKFYNRPFLDFIYSGYPIILIGYAGKFSFISSKLIGNAIRQIPVSLFEAAETEGISRPARISKILIPLILPSLYAAFIIAFIFSFGELGTTIMLYPPGTEILPIKVFTIMANAPRALTGSMVLIVFFITLVIITGFYFLAKPLLKKYNYVNS